uniref:Uncharacterized protein n=1 Tax=Imasa heleensis TaxID=2772037 RepID=A0A893DCK7_9EUKA|nr:hypothetical protein K8K73_mgp09 [Imasa heleensis]QRR29762.1 hypothetical protein [Imasa heleensis]
MNQLNQLISKSSFINIEKNLFLSLPYLSIDKKIGKKSYMGDIGLFHNIYSRREKQSSQKERATSLVKFKGYSHISSINYIDTNYYTNYLSNIKYNSHIYYNIWKVLYMNRNNINPIYGLILNSNKVSISVGYGGVVKHLK